MARSSTLDKTTPAVKNKFGFRPLRPRVTSQATPQARKAVGNSPKRPRDDKFAPSGGHAHAKRAKAANNITRLPVIEICDEEEPGPDVGGNDLNITTSRAPLSPYSRPISGDPAHVHIVDLTIDSPPSDNSPEPSASPTTDAQTEPDLPIMRDAEIVTTDSEILYQFEFQKSRGDPFACATKTEAEEQLPMSQRFRSITLKDDRQGESWPTEAAPIDRGHTLQQRQSSLLTKGVRGTYDRALGEGRKKTKEGPARTFMQCLGLVGASDVAPWDGEVIFKDIPARPGHLEAVTMLPAVSVVESLNKSQLSAAAPATPPILHTVSNARPKHTMAALETQLPSGICLKSRSRNLSGTCGPYSPAPARSYIPPSRIPVPTRAQTNPFASRDKSSVASVATAALKTTVSVEQRSVLQPGFSSLTHEEPLTYRESTVDSDVCDVVDTDNDGTKEYQPSKQARTVSRKSPSLSRERQGTPMGRIMPQNTLTPMRTAHFDGLVDRIAERNRLGIQPKPRIFLQQISAPNVQGARLELFWVTMMTLVGANQLFGRNYDRLSKCIGSVNEQLDEQDSFTWEEGYNVASELQNQRKLTMTSAPDPRLFFTRDGQEVMGVRPLR